MAAICDYKPDEAMKSYPRYCLALALAACLTATASARTPTVYDGPCDASAAAALDADHFVVGDDEHNILHIYRQLQAKPVGRVDLSAFLATDRSEEADIEGAAAIGTRIYWITSHARDAKGRVRPSRHRFFATDVIPGDPPTVQPAGRIYTRLLNALLAADTLAPYRLATAAQRAAEAPGGLNIEGLAATPEGTLLIGLRNPLRQGRALLVPLLNPGELIEGGSARFGAPVEIDLDQRGIRSIERAGASYVIAAGPTADTGSFALFSWSGRPGDAPTLIPGIKLRDLRPEALFAIPGSKTVQVLSDDGGLMVGGVECKKLPAARQHFRNLTITLPD
jgi:hypothetical protein